jgi:hypothetical protein
MNPRLGDLAAAKPTCVGSNRERAATHAQTVGGGESAQADFVA